MDAVHDKVCQQTAAAAKVERFEVGEIVGFRSPPKPNKLFKSYEINHRVIKVLSPVTYVIKNLQTGYERIVNVRKLRRVHIGESDGVIQGNNQVDTDPSDSGEENDNGDDGVWASEEQTEEEASAAKKDTKATTSEKASGSGNEEQISAQITSNPAIADTYGRLLRDRRLLKQPDRLQIL